MVHLYFLSESFDIYSSFYWWVLKGQTVFEQIWLFFLFSVNFLFDQKENINICYRLLSFSIYSTRSLNAFYIFIANAQPEGGGEDSGDLETVLNGEIHGFFFRYLAEVLLIWGKTQSNQSVIFSCFRELFKIRSNNCFN